MFSWARIGRELFLRTRKQEPTIETLKQHCLLFLFCENVCSCWYLESLFLGVLPCFSDLPPGLMGGEWANPFQCDGKEPVRWGSRCDGYNYIDANITTKILYLIIVESNVWNWVLK